MSEHHDDPRTTEGENPRKRPPPSPILSAAKTPKQSRKSKNSPGSETKANRGLRHFSMMVCKKVEEKGTTTYNEVADELVRKVIEERRKEDPDGKFDEKNIRRRVYDALNVLMAMDIISKEKKEITWKGLPSTGHQDMQSMEQEREFRRVQVERKREALRELLVQQVCFRNLVTHNQQRGASDEKIPLPFIVVNTHSSAVIQCDMSRDRTDVMFDFSMPFEINDDNTILKKMGMDKAPLSVVRDMLPEDLFRYCEQHRLLDNVLQPEPNHHRQQDSHPSRMRRDHMSMHALDPHPHLQHQHHHHQEQHHPRGEYDRPYE